MVAFTRVTELLVSLFGHLFGEYLMPVSNGYCHLTNKFPEPPILSVLIFEVENDSE
jgi:hypothetical protein